MSYQAHEYVCDLRGVTRGEKAILQAIARHLDQRTGVARVSQEHIGVDAVMSERHVLTLLAGMESRGIIARQREHKGRGAVTLFRFPGFAQKGEVASSFAAIERVKSVAEKGEIHAEKGEVASSCNKERKKNQELQEQTPSPTPPALQEGLTRRDVRNLAKRINKFFETEAVSKFEGIRRPEFCHMTDQQLEDYAVKLACTELLIPYEAAVRVMRSILPKKPQEFKKQPESVSA